MKFIGNHLHRIIKIAKFLHYTLQSKERRIESGEGKRILFKSSFSAAFTYVSVGMIKNYTIPVSDYWVRNLFQFMTVSYHTCAAKRAGNGFSDEGDVIIYCAAIISDRTISNIGRFNIQLQCGKINIRNHGSSLHVVNDLVCRIIIIHEGHF